MSVLSKLFLICAIILPTPFLCIAQEAKSGEATTESSPLLILRFNHPHLQYSRALYRATKQALEVKPDASFLFKVYVPLGKTKAENETWEKVSRKRGENVVKEMREMGVPMTRIETRYLSEKDMAFTMIHLHIL